jgi:hypothetical protein
VKLVLAAAVVLLATVPGAAAGQAPALQISLNRPVFSPNGNGVNDTVTIRTNAAPLTLVGLRVYAWGGRLSGWKRIRTGVSTTSKELTWNGTNAAGAVLGDGTYQVTVCHKDQGQPLEPSGVVRPGRAEASVRRPPWSTSGCAPAHPVRVERLAAFVDSTGSFYAGDHVPLIVSADRGEQSATLEPDCDPARKEVAFGDRGGLVVPLDEPPGLYHAVATDPAGDEFRAPVVVRSGWPLEKPRARTALVVWPYLSWRAYNAYDADLNGIPDSWYQFWRQRRVSLKGPLLRDGVEDDHQAAVPFSRWLCARPVRTQQITDVELGRLPLSTLRKYKAIVFPGHTEYYEPKTYDLLKRYRDEGGNLVFLQANPFYRQVRIEPAINAVEMTDFDARSGRRSDFALAGVGYDGCCFPKERAVPYVAAAGRDYDRVRWLFRGTGIGPGQAFGVAASESDRVDPGLSPPNHVVAAQALIRGKRGVIHAAMTWTRVGRGQVFATGNYTFLRMGRGITDKLLDNVWRKLVA